ncbi:MAG TPA: hypothetical protein PLV25_07795, partial [Opitutales bacterium]|nr:hypothetical protein [Opitutales bacterium]
MLISLIAVILIFPFTVQSPFAEVGNTLFGLLVIMTTLASCDLPPIDWTLAVILGTCCILARTLILYGGTFWISSGELI